MLRYALRRMLWVFPSVLAVSLISFFVLSLVPHPEAEGTATRQSHLESLLEATVNTASGFFVSWAVWIWVAAPLFDIPVYFAESLGITTLFTATSMARSYIWRRFFNAGINRRLKSWLT